VSGMTRRRASSIVGLTLVAVAAACGEGEAGDHRVSESQGVTATTAETVSSAAATSAPRDAVESPSSGPPITVSVHRPPIPQLGEEEFFAAWSANDWDFANAPFEVSVRHTQAALVVTVTSVGEARWNTEDGRVPTENSSTWIPYRPARVVVDEVLWRRAGAHEVRAGEELDLYLWGDGSNTGPDVGGLPPVTKFNQLSGPFEVGDRKLLFVVHDGIPHPSGEGRAVRGWVLADQFVANFRLEGDAAVNVLRPELRLSVAEVRPLMERVVEGGTR